MLPRGVRQPVPTGSFSHRRNTHWGRKARGDRGEGKKIATLGTSRIPSMRKKKQSRQAKSADDLPVGKGRQRAKSSVDSVGRKLPICAVVGMGASAGGLEAFKKFFQNMPADCGMAFVLIPHLDP